MLSGVSAAPAPVSNDMAVWESDKTLESCHFWQSVHTWTRGSHVPPVKHSVPRGWHDLGLLTVQNQDKDYSPEQCGT